MEKLLQYELSITSRAYDFVRAHNPLDKYVAMDKIKVQSHKEVVNDTAAPSKEEIEVAKQKRIAANKARSKAARIGRNLSTSKTRGSRRTNSHAPKRKVSTSQTR